MPKGSKRNCNMAPDTKNHMVGQRKEKKALPKADRSIGTPGRPYVRGSRAPSGR